MFMFSDKTGRVVGLPHYTLSLSDVDHGVEELKQMKAAFSAYSRGDHDIGNQHMSWMKHHGEMEEARDGGKSSEYSDAKKWAKSESMEANAWSRQANDLKTKYSHNTAAQRHLDASDAHRYVASEYARDPVLSGLHRAIADSHLAIARQHHAASKAA